MKRLKSVEIQDLFDKAWSVGTYCSDCYFFVEEYTRVPFGEASADMDTSFCNCDDPAYCPYVASKLEEEDEDDS